MSNSVQDGAEGLMSLTKYGWYRGGSIFVYDAQGRDISLAVGRALQDSNGSKKESSNSDTESIFGIFYRIFKRR